jgi:hypothetical protein
MILVLILILSIIIILLLTAISLLWFSWILYKEERKDKQDEQN